MNEQTTFVNFRAINPYRRIEICTIMDAWEECRHTILWPDDLQMKLQRNKPTPENFGYVLYALAKVNKSFIGNKASERYDDVDFEAMAAKAEEFGIKDDFIHSQRISSYAHPLVSFLPYPDVDFETTYNIGLIYDRYYGMEVTDEMTTKLFEEVANYVDSLQ